MKNLYNFNGIFVGLQNTLNPNIERSTRAIDMILSAFERYDVTLSDEHKLIFFTWQELSKI